MQSPLTYPTLVVCKVGDTRWFGFSPYHTGLCDLSNLLQSEGRPYCQRQDSIRGWSSLPSWSLIPVGSGGICALGVGTGHKRMPVKCGQRSRQKVPSVRGSEAAIGHSLQDRDPTGPTGGGCRKTQLNVCERRTRI